MYRAASVLHRIEAGPLEPVPLTEGSPTRTTSRTYPRANLEKLKAVFGWLDDEYDKLPVEREILGAGDPAGTILRLPMVYGPGDKLHRLAALVAHMHKGTDDLVIAESVAQRRERPAGSTPSPSRRIFRSARSPSASPRRCRGAGGSW